MNQTHEDLAGENVTLIQIAKIMCRSKYGKTIVVDEYQEQFVLRVPFTKSEHITYDAKMEVSDIYQNFVEEKVILRGRNPSVYYVELCPYEWPGPKKVERDHVQVCCNFGMLYPKMPNIVARLQQALKQAQQELLQENVAASASASAGGMFAHSTTSSNSSSKNDKDNPATQTSSCK